MMEVDIASIMDSLENEDSLKIFRILPKSMAADVFAELEVDDQKYIIMSLSTNEASNVIDNLMADDAADFLEEMPANVVKRILANASPEQRKDVNHLLQYPDDSAGSIMTVEYVDLKSERSVLTPRPPISVMSLIREGSLSEPLPSGICSSSSLMRSSVT